MDRYRQSEVIAEVRAFEDLLEAVDDLLQDLEKYKQALCDIEDCDELEDVKKIVAKVL